MELFKNAVVLTSALLLSTLVSHCDAVQCYSCSEYADQEGDYTNCINGVGEPKAANATLHQTSYNCTGSCFTYTASGNSSANVSHTVKNCSNTFVQHLAKEMNKTSGCFQMTVSEFQAHQESHGKASTDAETSATVVESADGVQMFGNVSSYGNSTTTIEICQCSGEFCNTGKGKGSNSGNSVVADKLGILVMMVVGAVKIFSW